MESNENTQVEPTPEEWKARALKAECALYGINDQMCTSSFVYGEDGDEGEDLTDLGEAIWEAAGIDLDEVPAPAEIAHRQTDRRPDCQDRVLYAAYNGWAVSEGAILAVGRSDDKATVLELLRSRWIELVKLEPKQSLNHGSPDRSLRLVTVDLHGRSPHVVPGWPEDDMRAVLLEGDPSHDIRLVEDRLNLGA